jgi:DNA-binding LacI/PurR family transcriptional regulator
LKKPDRIPKSTALTMSDLAKIAGLDKSTVSRALEDNPVIAAKTRARVQALAREHNYAINPVARSLRSRKTQTVAVVIPLLHEKDQPLSDPFFMMILSHLADAISHRGYDLLLSKVPTHVDGWLERAVQERRADAVIVIGQSLEHEMINTAATAGLPVVAWGQAMPGQRYATVGSDNHTGGMLATGHLLQNGRRRLAFMGNPDLPEVAGRLAGFRAAHDLAKIAYDPDLIINTPFSREEARRVSRKLATSGQTFDGVVCASDIIAAALIRALKESGRDVPGDVAVTGFDDAPHAAYNAPPITTIRQNVELGAQQLVDFALAAARGESPQSVAMPVRLIVRGSSASPA